MRIINNINSIIDLIDHPKYWLNSSDKQMEEFKKILNSRSLSKLGGVKTRSKSNSDKYYEYDKKKYNKIKREFFEKIYNDGNYYCPYCWKTLIVHWKNRKNQLIRSYDIEHFLPRSLYPDLSVNLYNWLPACMSCNQRLKKSINPLYKIVWNDWIFHPYLWFIKKDNHNKYYFDYNENIFDNFSFVENWNKNILNSTHWITFQLDNLYLYWEDTYKIFDFIYYKQSLIIDEYRKFNNTKTIDEYIDYFFNEYYPKNEIDLLKYDNWKFKYDLINDLREILKPLLESE